MLVRVHGIQCYQGYEDEFLVLRRELGQPTLERTLDNYRRLASFPGPRKLLLNLVNCEGKHYDISPYRSSSQGTFPTGFSPQGARSWPLLPPAFVALSSISSRRVSRGAIGRSSLTELGRRPSSNRPSTT